MLRAGWDAVGVSRCWINWENRGYETCGLVIWRFILFSCIVSCHQVGREWHWIRGAVGPEAAWFFPTWLSLPFPFLSIDLPHMCCLCVPAPGSSLRACSLVPFFHLSVLALVGNSFLSPPFLREKIKEELIHIIPIHNPIIGCMIHQLTLQEGHTLLAHYPLRCFCHGVTMSLHISFWRCSFLFSSSMQVSWLTFGSFALHLGGPLNFSFLGQRLSVECHHENALLGNLLWSELLQKGLLRHHSHLLLPESDEVDWA